MYFNYFDAAVYINLDKRMDRRQLFENRISQIGLKISRFSAITPDENDLNLTNELKKDSRCKFKIGCTLSHISIVKQAKQNGWKNVLIFEDDCIFNPDFIKKMESCVSELRDNKWDLFYMGGEPNVKCLPFSENLRFCPESGGIYGTHSYAINSSFYDRVINFNPYVSVSIDILYLHQINRIYLLAKELLAYQDDNLFSDLWGGCINRSNNYKIVYNQFVQ
jgi:GR25 family glycosyltransferase involved in LPS biosynthesis